MEDSRAVSGWLASQEMLQGSVSTPDEVVEKIDAVTPDDVARVAHRIFQPEQLRLAVVGPHRSEQQFLKLMHF
jgi:predicted Zn-dependent peptidase